MKIKNIFISTVVAGVLIGCGGSSDSDSKKENPNNQGKTDSGLTKLNVDTKALRASIAKQVSAYGEQGYNEMGDSKISSLSGDSKHVILGSKWHNGLSVLDVQSGEVKFTPFAALKNAGHNKADTATGATEAILERIEYSNGSVYANIVSESSKGKAKEGLYKVDLTENGTFNLENGQIKESKKVSPTEAISDFDISKDGSKVLAYDGSNAILYDKDLKELASKELKLIAFDLGDTQMTLVHKKGTKVFLSISNFDKPFEFVAEVELTFEPTLVKSLGSNKAVLIEEEKDKPLKLTMANLGNKRELREVGSTVVVNEINGIKGSHSYSVSPNNKHLALAGGSSVYLVALTTGKFEVLKTINTSGSVAIDFISDDKISYTNGKNDVSVAKITDTGEKLTSSDLIALKLEKINQNTINNGNPFTEVRKNMDFSTKKLYNSIDVEYEPTGLLTNYISNDGKFTKPDKTITDKLKIKGTQNGKVGVREIDLTLIGKDQKNTVVIDGENIINTVTIGDDKVVVATTKGLRSYKIVDGNLAPISSLVKLAGIDEIAPYGTFENTTIHKIDDNTLVGLGRSYTGQTVKMKGRRGDTNVKLFESKIFKVKVSQDGTIDSNISFIDIGAKNIKNIDVSKDKKILAAILTPEPEIIDDTINTGYKAYNKTNTFALLYNLETKSIETAKFEVKRKTDDKSPETIISLNEDGSKIMISESHHGVIKLYDKNGTFISDASKYAGTLNHMGSNYIVKDKIIGTPFKASNFGILDINNLDNIKYIDYPNTKAWFNKGDLVGNILHIPSSSRYVGGIPSIVKFDTTQDKIIGEMKYKIYKGEVDFYDVDYLSNKVILTGNRGKDGYLNVQSK